MNCDSLESLLQSDGPLPVTRVTEILTAVSEHVSTLHERGRLHLGLQLQAIRLQENGCVVVEPPLPAMQFGDGEIDDERSPPEAGTIRPLLIPTDAEQARVALKNAGVEMDPRRFDVYQLGSLAIRALTGASVRAYLWRAEVKSRVPRAFCRVIDGALGHDPGTRLKDCTQFREALQSAAVEDASAAKPSPQCPPGASCDLPFDRLGHYRVLERIGSGGMGDVYRGYDATLEREVAIKVLPLELARDEQFVARFRAEATAAAKIAHPNVVSIFFIGQDGGHHFFVMQLIEGESLAQRLKRRPALRTEEAIAIARDCLEGLNAAHKQGLIHRDIKPGNILIDEQTGRAILVDFGLVRRMKESLRMTATGVVMGTVDYLAPEQARGQSTDGRADLYSLGVLIYEMVSGRLPFEADSPSAMIFQHAYEKPRSLGNLAPKLPLALVKTVMRLLEKAPAARHQSAQDVLDDLRAISERRVPEWQKRTPANGSETDAAHRYLEPLPEMPPVRSRADRSGLRDWLARVFARFSPRWLERFQSTSQQADDALLALERRREQLTGLLAEARRLAAEMERLAQAYPADCSFRPQADDQHARVEMLEIEVAKADAEVVRLRNQRDALVARLRAAEAAKQIVHGHRPRKRRPRLQIALLSAGLIFALFSASMLLRDSPHPPQDKAFDAIVPSTASDEKLPLALSARQVRLPVGEWVDVLAKGDFHNARSQGIWRQSGPALRLTPSNPERLMLPLLALGSYDLQYEFCRSSGSDCVVASLPIGNSFCALILSGVSGKVSGINLIDGRYADDPLNPTQRVPGTLNNGRTYQVRIEVRKNKSKVSLAIFLDGQRHVSWSGEVSQLNVDPSWRPDETFRFGLGHGRGTDVTFQKMNFRLVSGEARLIVPPAEADGKDHGIPKELQAKREGLVRDVAQQAERLGLGNGTIRVGWSSGRPRVSLRGGPMFSEFIQKVSTVSPADVPACDSKALAGFRKVRDVLLEERKTRELPVQFYFDCRERGDSQEMLAWVSGENAVIRQEGIRKFYGGKAAFGAYVDPMGQAITELIRSFTDYLERENARLPNHEMRHETQFFISSQPQLMPSSPPLP